MLYKIERCTYDTSLVIVSFQGGRHLDGERQWATQSENRNRTLVNRCLTTPSRNSHDETPQNVQQDQSKVHSFTYIPREYVLHLNNMIARAAPKFIKIRPQKKSKKALMLAHVLSQNWRQLCRVSEKIRCKNRRTRQREEQINSSWWNQGKTTKHKSGETHLIYTRGLIVNC